MLLVVHFSQVLRGLPSRPCYSVPLVAVWSPNDQARISVINEHLLTLGEFATVRPSNRQGILQPRRRHLRHHLAILLAILAWLGYLHLVLPRGAMANHLAQAPMHIDLISFFEAPTPSNHRERRQGVGRLPVVREDDLVHAILVGSGLHDAVCAVDSDQVSLPKDLRDRKPDDLQLCSRQRGCSCTVVKLDVVRHVFIRPLTNGAHAPSHLNLGPFFYSAAHGLVRLHTSVAMAMELLGLAPSLLVLRALEVERVARGLVRRELGTRKWS
mmetsp:Transcript_7127/g.17734  ORF Transcript_7127/g.17734 Transcript_7127/m.17734 type:complete len:270 (-) Transcript_7127:1817-2626(-)